VWATNGGLYAKICIEKMRQSTRSSIRAADFCNDDPSKAEMTTSKQWLGGGYCQGSCIGYEAIDRTGGLLHWLVQYLLHVYQRTLVISLWLLGFLQPSFNSCLKIDLSFNPTPPWRARQTLVSQFFFPRKFPRALTPPPRSTETWIIFTAFLLWDRFKQRCISSSENIGLTFFPGFHGIEWSVCGHLCRDTV
jgi:hypothetical protein